jgi:mannose-1-phosphate guanylyltransferase
MAAPSNWAAVLAGGDGTRLQTLTRVLNGDERPKQFSPLLGGRSLLEATRARLCLNVEPQHTVCVVTRHHQPFYRRELADLPKTHLLEQPANRGTTSAIAAALVRIRRLAGDAVVGFFPADHYYRDACLFRRTVAALFTAAHADTDRIFLLGAEATRPETDYGWIQPGDPLKVPRLDAARRTRAFAVRGFREKPSEPEAVDLFARRCLWNTFVFAGHLRAFEAAMTRAQPDLWTAFDTLAGLSALDDELREIRRVYGAIPASDFSRDVLSISPERLGVIQLPGAGWTDLGQPSRVLDVLASRPTSVPVRPDRVAS